VRDRRCPAGLLPRGALSFPVSFLVPFLAPLWANLDRGAPERGGGRNSMFLVSAVTVAGADRPAQ